MEFSVFYSRSLKVYFLRRRNDSGTQNGEQVNEGSNFLCVPCCLSGCTSPGTEAESCADIALLHHEWWRKMSCTRSPPLGQKGFPMERLDQQLAWYEDWNQKFKCPRGHWQMLKLFFVFIIHGGLKVSFKGQQRGPDVGEEGDDNLFRLRGWQRYFAPDYWSHKSRQ